MQKLAKYPKHSNKARISQHFSDENELELHRDELFRDVERAVQKVTNRRIQALRIQFESDRVIISGHCKTYYVKQLAQEAVLQVVKNLEIINEIHVA